MSAERKKQIQVAYIGEGKIKHRFVDDAQKQSAFVRATLPKESIEEQQEHEHRPSTTADQQSIMKTELLRKLQLQRDKIQEEQERCDQAREAWVKHLDEIKQPH